MKEVLFRPFEKYSPNTLILIGILFTIIGTWMAIIFGTRFDGVLDFHISSNVDQKNVIFDNLINITCLTVFLFIAGKVNYKKSRLIDFVSTGIFSRTPLYLLPLLNCTGALTIKGDPTNLNDVEAHVFSNLPYFVIMSVVMILFIVWYVALMYNGFKTASNAKGKKTVLFFIGALLLAEITSSLLIHLIQ